MLICLKKKYSEKVDRPVVKLFQIEKMEVWHDPDDKFSDPQANMDTQLTTESTDLILRYIIQFSGVD